MCLCDEFIALAFLSIIPGRRAFQLLGFAVGSFYLSRVVLALPPANDAIVARIVCSEVDDLADSIKEQVNVSRVMDIGFDDKRITTSCQRFFFFSD
jgi:hypothetical protein